jgi:hypothetical protein
VKGTARAEHGRYVVRVVIAVMMLCLIVPCAAVAQKVADVEETDAQPRVDCNVDYYNAYSGGGGEVPDDDAGGVLFGPVATPSGELIEDVILFINMEHTWIGDLRIFLLYDYTCDGTGDLMGEVLCRPGLEGCDVDGCCGCGGNLSTWYAFDDDAPSIEDACPTDFVSGCYGPDYDSAGLTRLNGVSSGGCYWLFVADGAGGDLGFVHEWVVNVLYESTPVEESNWGTIKALYR